MPQVHLPPACRLIKRCGTRSLQYWSAQQAASAPSPKSKQRLYEAAVKVSW
jgi:hypothetical protein